MGVPFDTSVTKNTQSLSPLGFAAASAGGDLLNNLLSGISNRRQNKRMVDFWNMNNQYNHPSAQMERLREAGLNPNMIYGTGTQAAGLSSAPPKAVPAQPPVFKDPAGQIAQYKQFKLQSDNLRAQNTVLLNDAALKAMNAVKAGVEGRVKGQELKVLERTANDLVLQAGHKSALMLSQIGESNVRQQKDQILVKRLAQDLKIGEQNLSNSEKLGKLRDAELKLKDMGIDFYQANAILSILGKLMGLAPK